MTTYTASCPTCARDFSHPTKSKADLALHMHVRRAHTPRPNDALRAVYPRGTTHSLACPLCPWRCDGKKNPSAARTALRGHWQSHHHPSALPEIEISHSAPAKKDSGFHCDFDPAANRFSKPCPKCGLVLTAARRCDLSGNYARHVSACGQRAQKPPTVPSVPRPAARERVIWTADEIERLIHRAAELRLEEIELSLQALITQAQEVLPSDRHRHIPSNYLHVLKAKVKMRIDTIRKEELASLPPKIVTVPVRETVPVDPVQFTATLPTPLLLAELLGRFTRRIDGVEHALAHRDPPKAPAPAPIVRAPMPNPSPPPTPTSPRKPRLGVVGLFKDQFAFVADKLGDRKHDVDLVWIDKERSAPDLPAVDGVIVQKFTRHKWYEEARSALGPERVWFADGGIQSVAQKVLDFLSRQPR